ncbi:MAG: DUF4286 family protein [Lewinellaceae bacterium]|nr:DUF4286 family protein [Lewinellaceae bacterium]
MLLYNVTVKIEPSLVDEWLEWMVMVHIPQVMATGKFQDYRLCRMLGEEEVDGPTYATQYYCPDLETFQRYQQEDAPALQQDYRERFGNRYVAFRSLLEVIDQA